jgi:hypothetical protein
MTGNASALRRPTGAVAVDANLGERNPNANLGERTPNAKPPNARNLCEPHLAMRHDRGAWDHSDFDGGRGGQRGQHATARHRVPAPPRSARTGRRVLPAGERPEARVGRPVNPNGHFPIHY